MAKDIKILCPMMGGTCVEDGAIVNGELVACRFWITVQGQDPQTGKAVSNGDCAMAWMPVLMIENSRVNRETGAAIESMRNNNVQVGQELTRALVGAAENQMKLRGEIK